MESKKEKVDELIELKQKGVFIRFAIPSGLVIFSALMQIKYLIDRKGLDLVWFIFMLVGLLWSWFQYTILEKDLKRIKEIRKELGI